MHDFIRLQSFGPNRTSFLVRSPAADWVQRGIMRSFGEDNLVAQWRSNSLLPDRAGRKSRIQNRK